MRQMRLKTVLSSPFGRMPYRTEGLTIPARSYITDFMSSVTFYRVSKLS